MNEGTRGKTWLHVAFSCNDDDALAPVARSYLSALDAPARNSAPDSERFLNDLCERTGTNPGPKGGLCLWSTGDAGSEPRAFVDALLDFFTGVIGAARAAVVFYQRPGEVAGCYRFREMDWDAESDGGDEDTAASGRPRPSETFQRGALVVDHYRNLPFGVAS